MDGKDSLFSQLFFYISAVYSLFIFFFYNLIYNFFIGVRIQLSAIHPPQRLKDAKIAKNIDR